MSTWLVSSSVQRIELDASGCGEVVFRVVNSGTVPEQAVFDVAVGPGADRSWFQIVGEPRMLVHHGAAVEFKVQCRLPPGAAAGPSWLQGVAYTAERRETAALSNPVGFEVKPAVGQETMAMAAQPGSASPNTASTPGPPGSTPAYVGATSGYGSATSGYGSATPAYVGSTPGYAGSTPGYAGSTPAPGGPTAGHAAAMSGHGGPAPGHTGQSGQGGPTAGPAAAAGQPGASTATSTSPKPKPKRRTRLLVAGAIALVVIVALAAAGFFFLRGNDDQQQGDAAAPPPPPAEVVVPDVTQLPEEQAAAILQVSNLTVGEVVTVQRRNARDGIVVDQSIRQGTTVEAGQPIDIAVIRNS